MDQGSAFDNAAQEAAARFADITALADRIEKANDATEEQRTQSRVIFDDALTARIVEIQNKNRDRGASGAAKTEENPQHTTPLNPQEVAEALQKLQGLEKPVVKTEPLEKTRGEDRTAGRAAGLQK